MSCKLPPPTIKVLHRLFTLAAEGSNSDVVTEDADANVAGNVDAWLVRPAFRRHTLDDVRSDCLDIPGFISFPQTSIERFGR